MMKRRLSRFALEAAAALAALALAACGAEPYPTPAAEPPPPPPPPSALAGAPEPPPPPPPPYARASSAPVVIAMAPIPNPPEHPGYRGRRARRAEARAEARGYRYVAPVHPHAYAAAPGRIAVRPAPHRAVVAAIHPAAPAKAKAKPTLVAKAKAVAQTAKAKAVAAAAAVKAAPTTAVATAPEGNATSPLGDRATRLAALENALAEAIRSNAQLKAPSAFTANQPTDVTLTVPAAFIDTLHDEAMKDDLSDAAASANLTAVLSGDGFAVTPDTTQSQPLTAGQPTTFHWSVTAQQGAKGPLHADVGADLLGAGSDTLNLGSVQTDNGLGFLKTPKMYGVALLAVLAVLLLAWLARGRSAPTRSSSAQREARRAREGRPVNLEA